MEIITNNLIYILPPVVGFFIGLLTNGLAIFMLFHPYKEKRVFGVRLPFTPGAIPREHKRLAKKIADTVCKHLLTNDEIIDAFSKPEVEEYILHSIGQSVDGAINIEAESLMSLVPKGWEEDVDEFIQSVIKKLAGEINNIIESDAALEIVDHFVDRELKTLLDLRLNGMLNPEHIQKLEGIIKSVVTKVYHSIGLKEKAYSIINGKLDDFIFSSKKVSDLLSEDMLRVIEKNVIEHTEDLTKTLFIKMKSEGALRSVEEELKKKAKEHVNSLKFIPRILLEMPITQNKLESFLDDFITDARGENKLNKVDLIVIGKLKVIMAEKVQSIFGREIKDVIAEIPQDTIGQVKMEIEKKLFDIFADKELEELLIGELDKKIVNFEELEMHKIIPELTDHELIKIKEFITNIIVGSMRKDGTKELFSEKFSVALKGYLNSKLGNLSHLLSHSLVEKIKLAIFNKSFSMLKEKAPTLLEKLDIKLLVEQKVEEFPLDELERIVVQIAGSQLKSITFLGGVLGFLIGLIQVFINAL